jgi:cold shock CspA family protein
VEVRMSALTRGEVVSFDQVKGYGFIAPRDGGADLFLHVNDLVDDKQLVRPGVVVEFYPEVGERGPKASRVRLVADGHGGSSGGAAGTATPGSGPSSVARQPSPSPDDADDDLVDVWSPETFRSEITELLLHADARLTAGQIVTVRRALEKFATTCGWIAPGR